MSGKKDVIAALRDAKAVPLRHAKHGIMYLFPNGKMFLLGRDGCYGDHNAMRNALADIRRLTAPAS
jgi:hypothetical protein